MEGTLLFSGSHLSAICIFFILIALLYIFKNKQWMKTNGRLLILIALIGSELWLNYWYFVTGMWDIRFTLPFQLCSISIYLCTWMIWSKQKWSFEIAYFLGFGGALQAMITPELFYDFPHFRFLHFFIAHIAIILAVFYMLWVEKYHINLKSLWKAFGVLQIIALIVFFINMATGGNYMFLARKPSNASLIDLLGPYPWYILTLELVVLLIFFLLYLPIYVKSKITAENKKRLER